MIYICTVRNKQNNKKMKLYSKLNNWVIKNDKLVNDFIHIFILASIITAVLFNVKNM